MSALMPNPAREPASPSHTAGGPAGLQGLPTREPASPAPSRPAGGPAGLQGPPAPSRAYPLGTPIRGYPVECRTYPVRNPSQGYPVGAPSLLGQPYMAAWGPERLVIGASKSLGWTAEQALQMCRPESSSSSSRLTDAFGGEKGGGGEELQMGPAALGPFSPGPTALGPAALGPSSHPVSPSSSSLSAGPAALGPPPCDAEPLLLHWHPDAPQACEELRAAAVEVWAPLAGWHVTEVRWVSSGRASGCQGLMRGCSLLGSGFRVRYLLVRGRGRGDFEFGA